MPKYDNSDRLKTVGDKDWSARGSVASIINIYIHFFTSSISIDI